MDISTVMGGVATLSWLAVIAVVVVVIARAARGQGTKGAVTWVLVVILVAMLLTTVSAGIVYIQPEERGVVLSAFAEKGYREEALQPGLRWVIPFAEQVVRYSIAKDTYTMSIAHLEGQIPGDDSVAARTRDGQEIFVDASVIYSVDPDQVIDVHIAWQKRYADGLIRPVSRGIIRAAVSQFDVDEVNSTKRFEFVTQIETELFQALQENGLLMDEFVLRNITFSEEYAAIIEQKQIEEQRILQEENIVEQRIQQAEQARQTADGLADARVIEATGEADAIVITAEAQAEARVIQATAEAQALQLIADVLRDNPDLLTFEYIDKLAPGIQVMLVPSDNPYLLPLPALESGGSAE